MAINIGELTQILLALQAAISHTSDSVVNRSPRWHARCPGPDFLTSSAGSDPTAIYSQTAALVLLCYFNVLWFRYTTLGHIVKGAAFTSAAHPPCLIRTFPSHLLAQLFYFTISAGKH